MDSVSTRPIAVRPMPDCISSKPDLVSPFRVETDEGKRPEVGEVEKLRGDANGFVVRYLQNLAILTCLPHWFRCLATVPDLVVRASGELTRATLRPR